MRLESVSKNTKALIVATGLLAMLFGTGAGCDGESKPAVKPNPGASGSAETVKATEGKAEDKPAKAEGQDEAKEKSAAAGEVAKEKPADKPAWRFLEVNGKVTLNGKPAAVDMPLKDKDAIRTGKKGRAIVTFGEGNVVEIRADSSLVLAGSPESKQLKIKLALGTLWNFITQGADLGYRVDTPNAVAGVRGTVFFVKATKKATHVCACKGKTHMHNKPKGRRKKKRRFDKVVDGKGGDHNYVVFRRGKKAKQKGPSKPVSHTDEMAKSITKYLPTAE